VARWLVFVCALAFGAENAKLLALIGDDDCTLLSGFGDAADPCPDECPRCSCCGHLVSPAVPSPNVVAIPAPLDNAPVVDVRLLASQPPRDILHIPKAR
jgi:hypothetical protein